MTRSLSRRIFPLLLALLVVVFDRWSKLAVQHSMTSFDSTPVIPGWLRLIHTENAGAAFGILADGNRWLRSGVLVGVSSIVLVFVLLALWGKGNTFASFVTRTALGLILGGALGNLYDRVVSGTVTDFIEVYHGAWSFPAFNVADSAITTGAVLLLVEMIFHRDRAEHGGTPHLVES